MSKTVQHEVAKAKSRGQKRVKLTGEVFTPIDLCLKIVRDIPEETLRNPDSKFLDNSCGDGNFLVALKKVLTKYHSEKHVLNAMIYGVDLMPDNVDTARERLGLKPNMPGWAHVVCADALSYGYEFASEC